MKNRKRIALLAGQPEENYQNLFIQGFLKKAFASDYDVCIFAMYQKYQESTAREIGESTIFSLIRYDLFDAVVVLLDTLQTPGVAKRVEEKLKRSFSGPVFCIDKESKYFPTIMTDHYTPVKRLIAHLIERHGFKDIAYLTGKEWHIHSKQRLQAYMDCMKEYGLPVRDNRVFYGDFWYSSGESMVEKLLKDREHLPEAIACANDCMAIGVAQALTDNGIRVPEDVAVVGYDSVEEGRMSPKPITSAPIPAKVLGGYTVDCLKAEFEDAPMPEFCFEPELFIGSSCGCHNESMVPRLNLRESWGTDISEGSFYSCFNHMMEDMLSQSSFKDLMNVIFSYVYQIRDFDSFHLCLNEYWGNLKDAERTDAGWKNYTRRMLHILECGTKAENRDKIDFHQQFDTKILLPDLYVDRDEPKAFFFTPLHFEERCLGYAVISYGNEAKCYNDTYRLWLRSVMQGLECFRRVEALQQSNKLLQESQIRDSLTGLYNYKGFIQQSEALIRRAGKCGGCISAMAIDIKGLAGINDEYGREEGNQAIIRAARFLANCAEGGMSCCLGNGEYMVAILSEGPDKKEIHAVRDKLLGLLEKHNRKQRTGYDLQVYTGSDTAKISDIKEFEHLVNSAVSRKNGNKISVQRMADSVELTKEEMEEAEVVRRILEENLFLYHFQPIINAKNGEIFAYEALMRGNVTPQLSPVKILKYAGYFGKLYDVEKATFFNIIRQIRENGDKFAGKKVFINSIPGKRLKGEDAALLEKEMGEHAAQIVVELTEQTELDDDALALMKASYEKMGIETAVDDYGTGYSNVTNLLRYMPNYVKIDRMLLTDIQNSPQKQHFVREIIEFAHDNDIVALAEGVETSEELEMVVYLGADLIQGFYTAKPSEKIAEGIRSEVVNQILQYNQQRVNQKGHKVYVAGKEGRVSLAKLVAEKYAKIEIVHEKTTYRDITIAGVPGLVSNMTLQIGDGYQGRIVLENVIFDSGKAEACIDIGKQCEVTLVLKGDSEIKNGGIRVPENSRLILEGNGNLLIEEKRAGYFGIGDDLKSHHGIIEFEQDGTIEIRGNGMQGVGIGSGYGGEIRINRGKYILEMRGKEGVGIGAFYSEVRTNIIRCDLQINMDVSRGVGIGSIEKSAGIKMENSSAKFIFGGEQLVGIGTIDGEKGKVDICNGSVEMDMRASRLCGIGAENGLAETEIQYASLYMAGEGKYALAIGSGKKDARIQITNSTIHTKFKSSLDSDMGAEEENIYIANSRCQFTFNGKPVLRKIKDTEW
ncbi:MAG: EAL domain-containing protein [Bacteroidales bacterium]|nr:EAL domain-containing protein [Clostridium sp.]MCM1204069.1 EAL domain-containing protein [Bacteroidales bacterium]